ncbi:hypothetical protein AUC61_22640 [Pseudomonas sp. S25]|uniref:Uncharacterized protein n=1 Tax=Pseudomonas maioricensis TaxID=1766623 RepID=A0ABS9ZP39_9PSED|nr:hypothetical protein [Pseudomonas sp. S25]
MAALDVLHPYSNPASSAEAAPVQLRNVIRQFGRHKVIDELNLDSAAAHDAVEAPAVQDNLRRFANVR